MMRQPDPKSARDQLLYGDGRGNVSLPKTKQKLSTEIRNDPDEVFTWSTVAIPYYLKNLGITVDVPFMVMTRSRGESNDSN